MRDGIRRANGSRCIYDFNSADDRSKTGRFFSPRYPQHYPPHANCQFFFNALPHEQVKVTFDSIELEVTAGRSAQRRHCTASCLKHVVCLILYNWKNKEARLMLTNPRDAVRGQPRSPNIVPTIPYVRCSFLLHPNSNFVFKTRRFFPIFDFKKCRDLENRVRGPSRSLECHHSLERI